MGKLNPIIIENARIVFRNFTGREGQYNRAGDRNFGVLLDEELAQVMQADGWNVKRLKKREDDDPSTPEQPWIEVAVSFKGRPPRAFLISSRGRTPLGEDMIEILDSVEIALVDLKINPYEWVVNGNQGVKAYMESIFVTVREDDLDRKYAEVQDAPRGHVTPQDSQQGPDF